MRKQIDVSTGTCNEFFKLLKNFAYYELIAISMNRKLPVEKRIKVFHFDSIKFTPSLRKKTFEFYGNALDWKIESV